MTELQQQCAIPLGEALARFELHWDDPKKDEGWCRDFTDGIARIIRSSQDTKPGRPFRGDIWLYEQGGDPELDVIRRQYDRRSK